MPNLGSVEMTYLWLSIILGLVHVVLAATAGTLQRGLPWALGPRDGEHPPVGPIAGRLERAWRNFLETFPLFVAAVLIEVTVAKHNAQLGSLGVRLYFYARVAY